MAAKSKKAYMKFNGGLISKNADARTDIRAYQYGLDEFQNCLPIKTGGFVRRGGFKHRVTLNSNYSSSTPICKGIPFIFKTDDTSTATGSWNVYAVVIAWNHSTEVANILIYDPNGNLHTTLTADTNGNALPFDEDTIPNIYYDQRGDVLNIVDSVNNPYAIKRTGSAGSYSFTIEVDALNDNPFTGLERIQFELVNLSIPVNTVGRFDESYGFADDASEVSAAFADWKIVSTGVHNEDATNELFASWGDVGNHGLVYPAWLEDRPSRYAYKLEGIFILNSTGKYTFALNSETEETDLYVDNQNENTQVASFYANGGSHHSSQPIGTNEFAGGTKQISNSKILQVGAHNMILRSVHSSASSPFGVTAAWRKESHSTDTDGIDRDVDSSGEDHPELSLTSREWNGRSIYEIEIEIDGSDTFKWRKRARAATLDDDPSWDSYEASTQDMSPGGSYDTDITLSADISYVQGDPSTGTTINLSNEDLAVIQFSGAGTVGDKYRFMVGFARIPLSVFEARETQFSVDKFPYTVKYHESRKFFGGTDNYPFRIYGSQSALYDSYRLGSNDDEGIETDCTGGGIDKIQWMESFGKLVVGTEGAIFSFPTQNEVMTPKNSKGRVLLRTGSSFVRPVSSEYEIYFVNNAGTEVYALQINEFGEFRYKNITAIIEDKFAGDNIKELAFTTGSFCSHARESMNIVWVRTDEGKLRSYSFDATEQFSAWADHVIGGQDDESAFIHSIFALPFVGGHRLYALISYDNLGLTLQHIDYDAFTDHEITTTSISKSSSSGGQEYFSLVGLSLSSLDSNDLLAARAEASSREYPLTLQSVGYDSSGVRIAVESPYDVGFPGADDGESWSDQATTIYLGLYFEAKATTLPPEVEMGGGTSQGHVREWADTLIRLRKTLGRVTISRLDNSSREIPLKAGNIRNTHYKDDSEANPQDFKFDIIGSGTREQLTIKHTSPCPLTVLMLAGDVYYET